MRSLLVYLLGAVVLAMTTEQARQAREMLKRYKAPEWAVIVDGVQYGTYAYTTADRSVAYVDFERFKYTPKTLANVLRHEVEHLKGRNHNNVTGDIMSYAMTIDTAGNVVEDAAVWP